MIDSDDDASLQILALLIPTWIVNTLLVYLSRHFYQTFTQMGGHYLIFWIPKLWEQHFSSMCVIYRGCRALVVATDLTQIIRRRTKLQAWFRFLQEVKLDLDIFGQLFSAFKHKIKRKKSVLIGCCAEVSSDEG
jgi:hypothetical protein